MRAVDLFSGCGGLSKGFQNAGYDIRLAVENWEPARKSYQANFDHPVSALDLSEVDNAISLIKRRRPEIIIGGPPCQDFSAAGGREEGARAKLTVDFARIIAGCETEWFVLENVEGIVGSDAWEHGRKILKRAGFGITECKLNAAMFGVPQLRKRFFAIGCMGEHDNFLFDSIDDNASDEPMTLRDHVGDEFGIDYYYRHPRNWGRRGVFSLDEPSPTVRSTNRPVPPGYTAHPDDAGPHAQARPLSLRERARVQTFPKSFRFYGTETDQNMMIANAVPVALARQVASSIRRYKLENAMNSDPKFRNWLSEKQDYTPRTAGNVISRIKRASRLLQVKQLPKNPTDAIQALERNKEYASLSSSVRSQIKRAIHLQAEFTSR